jgi:uncharacterized protein (DUF302 family)
VQAQWRSMKPANSVLGMPDGAWNIAGFISVACVGTTDEVVARLSSAIRERGITLFATLDHAAGAADVGLALRPTTVLIFGNPKAGTHLMQERQEIGLDLPLRMLVWTDAADQTWMGYSDPAQLAQRYGLPADAVVAAMQKLLKDLAEESAK